MNKLLVLALLAASAACALAQGGFPEGFEDELYCPKDTCLHERPRPEGFSGPRVAFHDCVNVKTGQPQTSPRPWGSRFNVQYKEQLIKDGFHTTACNQDMVINNRRFEANNPAARGPNGLPGPDPYERDPMMARRMMHDREMEALRNHAAGYPQDGRNPMHGMNNDPSNPMMRGMPNDPMHPMNGMPNDPMHPSMRSMHQPGMPNDAMNPAGAPPGGMPNFPASMNPEERLRLMREYNERRGAHPTADQMREEMRMRHERLDEERRREFEERRRQYEKMHEERMALLKEKHPEHYARMEARRQELEKERDGIVQARMNQNNVAADTAKPASTETTKEAPKEAAKPAAEAPKTAEAPKEAVKEAPKPAAEAKDAAKPAANEAPKEAVKEAPKPAAAAAEAKPAANEAPKEAVKEAAKPPAARA